MSKNPFLDSKLPIIWRVQLYKKLRVLDPKLRPVSKTAVRILEAGTDFCAPKVLGSGIQIEDVGHRNSILRSSGSFLEFKTLRSGVQEDVFETKMYD